MKTIDRTIGIKAQKYLKIDSGQQLKSNSKKIRKNISLLFFMAVFFQHIELVSNTNKKLKQRKGEKNYEH